MSLKRKLLGGKHIFLDFINTHCLIIWRKCKLMIKSLPTPKQMSSFKSPPAPCLPPPTPYLGRQKWPENQPAREARSDPGGLHFQTVYMLGCVPNWWHGKLGSAQVLMRCVHVLFAFHEQGITYSSLFGCLFFFNWLQESSPPHPLFSSPRRSHNFHQDA